MLLSLTVILFADWMWSEMIWIRIDCRAQGSPTAGSVQDCHGYAWPQFKTTWIEYFLKFWNMINYIGTRDRNMSLKRRCHQVSWKDVFLCWVSWNLWTWKCKRNHLSVHAWWTMFICNYGFRKQASVSTKISQFCWSVHESWRSLVLYRDNELQVRQWANYQGSCGTPVRSLDNRLLVEQ